MRVQLKAQQVTLTKEIESISLSTYDLMARDHTLADAAEVAAGVRRTFEAVERAEAAMRKLEHKEELLGLERTAHPKLADVRTRFTPYSTLWSAAHDWLSTEAALSSATLGEINAASIERQLASSAHKIASVSDHFLRATGSSEAQKPPKEVAVISEVNARLDGFRPYLPLLNQLCGPAMRAHHWGTLTGRLGHAIDVSTTFGQLVSLDVLADEATIQAVCEEASSEYEVELLVAQIEREHAEEMAMVHAPFARSFGTVIANADELTAWLEEQSVKLASVQFSPERERFAARLDAAQAVIEQTSGVFGALIRWQRAWMFLQPILMAEDIILQLPTELSSFKAVDALWKKTMRAAEETRYLVAFAARPQLLEQAEQAIEALEGVTKGLARYLDDKRHAFGRFHFLSNDEVLQLISHSTQPHKLQPYFCKLWAPVRHVHFAREADPATLFRRESLRGDTPSTPRSSDGAHAHAGNRAGSASTGSAVGSLRRTTSASSVEGAAAVHDVEASPSRPGSSAPLPPIAAGSEAIRRSARGSSADAHGLTLLDAEPASTMVAIESFEGELLPLSHSPPVVATGRLEVWLASLERAILRAVHASIQNALQTHEAAPAARVAWALRGANAAVRAKDRPSVSQATILVTQLKSTADITEALRTGGGPACQSLRFKLQLALVELGAALREPLAARERTLLSALLISDVHTRDVLSALCDERTAYTGDFAWLRVLRYYIGRAEGAAARLASTSDGLSPMAAAAVVPAPGAATGGAIGAQKAAGPGVPVQALARTSVAAAKPAVPVEGRPMRARTTTLTLALAQSVGALKSTDVMGILMGAASDGAKAASALASAEGAIIGSAVSVAQLDASFAYGYEYLGCTPRLVVTPLTDRVTLTSTQALALKLGVALSGAAGVGKTEMVKDLSKAFAQHCVSFTCTHTHDASAMARIFRGIASTGAWACLDELSRIPAAVLSVAAQQLLALQRALRADLPSFDLDGLSCPLQPTCAVFATMDAHAPAEWRGELPASLRSLFRPVALVSPHAELVFEIRLASYGFVAARSLAAKVATAFDLLHGLLAAAPHHEFSLRLALASVDVAGRLRLSQPQSPEESLLVRALTEAVGPRLSQEDGALFRKLLHGIWPPKEEPERAPATEAAREGQALATQTAAGELALAPEAAADEQPPAAEAAAEASAALDGTGEELPEPPVQFDGDGRTHAFPGAPEATPSSAPAPPAASEPQEEPAARGKGDVDNHGDAAVSLQSLVRDSAAVLGLQAPPDFVSKCTQLFELLQSRAGALLVGSSGLGKSALISTLANALSSPAAPPPGLLPERTIERFGQPAPAAASTAPALAPASDSAATDSRTASRPGDEALMMLANSGPRLSLISGRSGSHVGLGGKEAVVVTRCSPKAHPISDFFGHFATPQHAGASLGGNAGTSGGAHKARPAHPQAGEWVDGLLPQLLRAAARTVVQRGSTARHWLVLDGPLDSQWVEAFDTVLDDTRKLTLPSQETIALNEGINVIFEIEDVAGASPSMVSRCGMLFLEPRAKTVPLIARVTAWVARLPNAAAALGDGFALGLADAILAMLQPALDWLEAGEGERRERDLLGRSEALHAECCLRLLRALLEPFLPSRAEGVSLHSGEQHSATRASLAVPGALQTVCAPLIFQSLVWSIGCAGEQRGRESFAKWARVLAERTQLSPPLPPESEGSVYDVVLEVGGGWHSAANAPDLGREQQPSADMSVRWRHWAEEADTPRAIGPQSLALLQPEQLVPTTETVRLSWLMRALGTSETSVLLVGASGSGKSLLCRDVQTLARMAADGCVALAYSLRAKTHAEDLRAFLERKLEMRAFGALQPPSGALCASVLLDDLNVVEPDAFGAVPALELVRQWLDAGGWHLRPAGKADFIWRAVERVRARATLAPTNAHRAVSARLLRHFNVLTCTPLDDAAISTIFTTMIEAEPTLRPHAEAIVNATVGVYNAVRAHLRPSASSPQYAFNPRDISKVVRGILRSPADQIDRPGCLPRLWWHECSRVFADRCASNADVHWFGTLCAPMVRTHFGADALELMPKRPKSHLLALYKDAAAAAAAAMLESEGPEAEYNPMDFEAEAPLIFADFVYKDAGSADGFATAGMRARGRRSSNMEGASAAGEDDDADQPLSRGRAGMTRGGSNLFGHVAATQRYVEVTDVEVLNRAVRDALNEYNELANAPRASATAPAPSAFASGALRGAGAHASLVDTPPISRVLFTDMLVHLTRIHRVLRQPSSHLLLLGAAGSGRSTLVRIAAFLAGAAVLATPSSASYNLAQWRAELRGAVLRAGESNERVVLLVSEASLDVLGSCAESVLEDLSQFVSMGAVSDLLLDADQKRVDLAMRVLGRAEGRAHATKGSGARKLSTGAALASESVAGARGGGSDGAGLQDSDMAHPAAANVEQLLAAQSSEARWLRRVQANLHVVCVMSLQTQRSTDRLRAFPALTKCCTINFVHPWPVPALIAVAEGALLDTDVGASDERARVCRACAEMHMCAVSAAEDERIAGASYLQTSAVQYVEMVNAVSVALTDKRALLVEQRERLQNGLSRIREAEADAEQLQAELEVSEPEMIAKTAEVDSMTAAIEHDREIVRQARAVVMQEEQLASKKAEEAFDLRADAERELAEALPALEEAVLGLKALSTKDIMEVARYVQPPAKVKLVLEAVCILFHIQPKKVVHQSAKVDDVDYWDVSRRLLGDAKGLLDSMLTYDREAIDEQTIEKLKPYIEDPDFDQRKIATASSACAAMCGWVNAMYQYYHVNLVVRPKRAQLEHTNSEMRALQTSVMKLQKRLHKIQAKITQLQSQYDTRQAEKAELITHVEETKARIGAAKRLIAGLNGEKDRWMEALWRATVQEQSLLGDTLLWAATVVHIGPFRQKERRALQREWAFVLQANDLKVSAARPNSARTQLTSSAFARSLRRSPLTAPPCALCTPTSVLRCAALYLATSCRS